MKIVIPLAGRGSRFKNQGYNMPKPLIPIGNKPMIGWAIESVKKLYPQAKSKDFIFIVLKEHEDGYEISDTLKKLAGQDITIRIIDEVTEGAACTVLTTEDLINNDEDMLTCDCDQFFDCPEFENLRKLAIKNNWGGLVPTFEKDSPAYSYVKLDENGNAIETAEKKIISTHAAVGIYYFTKGANFVWAAKEMIKKNIRYNNEFYMCPLYNELIKRGDVVKIVPTKEWMTIGTPEEAKIFLNTR